MEDAMVTGRMPSEKKARGGRVLDRLGLNASQAINLLYDRLVNEQSAGFLVQDEPTKVQWENAARLVDSIASPVPVHTRFDNMTRSEIALDQAKAKGLV